MAYEFVYYLLIVLSYIKKCGGTVLADNVTDKIDFLMSEKSLSLN